MRLIVCLDDHNGMLFHHRRVSQDRAVRADMREWLKGRCVWMNSYSSRQFTKTDVNVIVSEDFLENRSGEDICFVEDQSLADREEQIQGIVVYCWNRIYPSDVQFDIDLSHFTLVEEVEFPGYSHERITRREYGR